MNPIRSLKFTSLILFLMFLVIFPGCGGITTPGISQDTLSAVITTSSTSGEAPLEVIFDASESSVAEGNEIVSYEWDFGDGKTGEGGTVHHGFDSPGNYTVILTISDNKGAVDTSSVIITVFQPSETIVEQTFNAQDGIEFDTGTGLVVSVLPDPNGEQKKLIVTENLNPQQPAGEIIKLQSVYKVYLLSESSSQEQGITLKNDIGINSKTILTFDIPSGVNPSDAMIIEWTEEGWTIPFLVDSIGAISAFGGEISADGKHISIGVTLTSKDYPDLNKIINQKDWWPPDSDIIYCGVGHAFDNAMKAASPKKKEDPPDPKENVIYKTIKLWSPKLPLLGGIWYKVNVSDDEELQGKPEWTTAKPVDITIFANSEGMYLEPTKEEDDSGHLKLKFPLDGGMVKVSLNPKDALIFQIVGWIPIIGPSAELGENCAPYVDNIRRISSNDKEAVWKVIENLAYICEEIGETSFKEAVKYYAGNWYLLGNIEMYLNTIIDFNSDNPEGSYEWQIEVKPVNKIPVVSITSPTDGSTYTEGETIVFEGKATDPEDGVLTGDSLFWSLPSGKVIGTGESFSKNDLSVGTYAITLNAVDSQSLRGEYSVTITVTAAEKPDLRVAAVSLSKSSAQVGDTISVTFTVENKGGPVSGEFQNRVFLSTTQYGGGGQKIPLEDFPMSLGDLSSKVETVKITVPQVPVGDWYVAILADATKVIQEANEDNNIDSAPISICTNYPPVITSTPVTSATVGQAYSYDVNATDPEDDSLTYSLTEKPTGMTINSSTGLITWTPSATGDYDITVKVSDGTATVTQSFTITVTLVTPETYTITASAGFNGSISPSGNVTVNQGSDKSFTITPDSGYSIDDVLVDGGSIGAISSYTFINVTENHTISATFKSSDVISAIIISYSPSSKITVDTGQSFTISTSFKNTGTAAAYFYAGASVWDSSGNIIFNDWGGKTYLNKDQQGSASWSHTINTPGEYWLQFGVWDETKSELFDKKPSPSQNLIKVIVEPPITSAIIISYSPSSKITVDTGQSFTISTSFKNTGTAAAYFYAGASVWDSSGNIIFNDWGGKTYLNKDQQGSASWSHTINTPGEYWLQFGVWDETKSELFDKKPSPSQNLIKVIVEPPITSAIIISYSPSSKITVDTGQSFTISTSFKNTGTAAAYFYAGASVWDSSGNIIFNDWGGKTYLNKDQQGSASWSHTINTPGEYWLQFGVWDETKSELFDKKPSPSQNLIKVIVEPPITSAIIISYSPSSKITVDTGQSFTISTSFKNTGTAAAYFYAGASVWDSSGNIIFNDWGGKTYLNKDQQGSASWSHTINTPGEYWLQFGVWDETKSELFDKKPSPSQNLIKVIVEPPITSAIIISYSPSSKITVDTGQSFTISTSFKNTGTAAAYFYAGASVWDSSGNIIFNDWGGKTYLNKDQQGSASWSHTINTPGEYWLQFGVWDETKSELFDKKPSPSQNLIKVIVEPPITSAIIISYSPSSKITVDTGQSFTISTSFKNTGTAAAYFYAGASVWDSSGNIIFNDWGGKTYLNKDQQGSASWSHTINTPGEYWLQFGVWDETKSELFDKKPSPSQNLIKVDSITQLAPQVTGVDPSQPTANPSRQYITILGNNFVGGAQVTLQISSSVYPIPEDRTQFIDSTRIKVFVGLTDSGNWKVWITNPDGQKSNEYIFYVKP